MAKILCVTADIRGTLYPAVELARRLAAAGHRLTFASFAEVEPVVTGAGLPFISLAPSRYSDFLAADRNRSWVHRLRHLSQRRLQALEALALERWTSTIRELEPDLILIDGEMHEHVIAASSAGVPIALLNSFVSIWRRPGLPPPHHLVRPGVGIQGSRVGIWLLWQWLWLRKIRRAMAQKIQRMGCDRLSLLQVLAREQGFDFPRETDDRQWLMPFTYRRVPTLTLHALEFELPHPPAEGVHYVGPMLLKERGDAPLSGEARAELDAIYERRQKGRSRLIYAGFGSFFSTDRTFLNRLMGAVAARDDWQLVISLGGRMASSDLGELPERIHAFRWLPQLEVLRFTDVAVVHGGINTIDECVLHGVPMLVYCGFETDMGGNTARIEHHGLGIVGDRRRDTAKDIERRLDRLFHEPQFVSNVEQMRSHYVAYSQDRTAERVVESLLNPTASVAS